jgi:hypothetical protein
MSIVERLERELAKSVLANNAVSRLGGPGATTHSF